MSARDVITGCLPEALAKAWVEQILYALTSSGYRILGPDEVDAVTVEKCAEVAEERAEWVPLKSGDMRTAIRALAEEKRT